MVVAGLAPIAVGNVLGYSAPVPPGFYQVQVRGRAGSLVGPLSNQVVIPVGVNTPGPGGLSGILNGTGVLLTWSLPPSTVGLTWAWRCSC